MIDMKSLPIPESLLYQSGYLTLERVEDFSLTLDYPNREVRNAFSKLYLEHMCHVEQFASLGNNLWQVLGNGDFAEMIKIYNSALAKVQYENFPSRKEYWYRMIFDMLLGAGASCMPKCIPSEGVAMLSSSLATRST